MDLLSLPRDVLSSCFLPLLSIRDVPLLDIAFSNKGIRPRLREIWKLYQHNDIILSLSHRQLQLLLHLGVQILGICVQDVSLSCVELIVSNIPHLKRMRVVDVTDDILLQLTESCSRLEELFLAAGQYTDVGIIAIAQHCPHLHTHYINNYRLTDASIQALCANCPLLTDISIRYCSSLSEASLVHIANTLPHLQSIMIYGCRFIMNNSLVALSLGCHELRSVAIGGFDFGDISVGLAALWAANPHLVDVDLNLDAVLTVNDALSLVQCTPHLRKLTFYYCRGITDAAVIAVAEHCLHLTSIQLMGCHNLTDASLVALGQHCHELERIDISDMKNITDVGIAALATGCPLLQEICARDTNISEFGRGLFPRRCRVVT